jgi:hypothetical protein
MNTTTKLRAFLLTILSVPAVLPSGSVFATCLAGNPSLEQEFQNAAMVFVGRVASEKFTSESKNYLDGITYTIHVEEVLRGSRQKTVRIFSENTSGRFRLQIGASYLILAYKELDRLQVDNCGNSGEVSNKSEALALLRKMKTDIR